MKVLKLIQQVVKKLLKDKPPVLIAEELEEEEETITWICQVAKEAAPEYDCWKILENMKVNKDS